MQPGGVSHQHLAPVHCIQRIYRVTKGHLVNTIGVRQSAQMQSVIIQRALQHFIQHLINDIGPFIIKAMLSQHLACRLPARRKIGCVKVNEFEHPVHTGARPCSAGKSKKSTSLISATSPKLRVKIRQCAVVPCGHRTETAHLPRAL